MSKKIYWLLIALSVGVIIFCINMNNASEVEAATPIEVYNGQDFKLPSGECYCPFTIQTVSGNNYYVYMEDQSGNNDFSFYIQGGETVEKKVPVGRYKIFCCSGDTWYGEDAKFGKRTIAFKSDKILEFTCALTQGGLRYLGHTISLCPTPGGNLPTKSINANSFPK